LSEAAFRAAGQALSALWQEAPINHVDVDGIELNWPGELTRNQPCEQIKMEINLGLAGIAAQDRYRFGWVPGHEFIDSWRLSAKKITELHKAREQHARRLWLQWPTRADASSLGRLADVLTPWRGGPCQVAIRYAGGWIPADT